MPDSVQRDQAAMFVDLLLPRMLGERMVPLDDVERAERTLRWSAIFCAAFSLITGVYGTLLASRDTNYGFQLMLAVFGGAFFLLFVRFFQEGSAERERARAAAMMGDGRSDSPFSRMLDQMAREMRRLGDGDEEVGFLRYVVRVLGETVLKNGTALSRDEIRQKVRGLYPFYDDNTIDDLMSSCLRIGLLQENAERRLSMNPTFSPDDFRRRDLRPA